MLEAAIAVPLILLLLGVALSFGQLWYQRIVIAEAITVAGRDGSTKSASCLAAAREDFTRYGRNFLVPISGDVLVQNPSSLSAITGLKEFSIQADVRLSCAFCPLVRAMLNIDLVRRFSYAAPFEDQDTAC